MKKIFFIGIAAALCMIGVVMAAPVGAAPLPEASLMVGDHPAASLLFGGLLVNKETLRSLFTGLQTIFNTKLKQAGEDWKKTAMEVISTAAGEDYVWLSRFPKLKKWVGSKSVKNIEAGKYYKKNEDWETTIAVKRNDIEDDRIGLYEIQTKGAAESAAELHDIILADLKNNAFKETCFDGQYFYDTDHPVGKESVSNKGSGVLAATNLAAVMAGYGKAREAIMTFKDEEGMPLNLFPDTLEVPPALEAIAKIICEKDKLQDNSPNPFQGTAKVLVNPMLTDPKAWMLHVASKDSVKPFIIQMRKRPVFVQQTGEENDDVFDKGEYKFGAEARATGVYGFWQLSYGSTGTA